jgi:hypothetical protein
VNDLRAVTSPRTSDAARPTHIHHQDILLDPATRTASRLGAEFWRVKKFYQIDKIFYQSHHTSQSPFTTDHAAGQNQARRGMRACASVGDDKTDRPDDGKGL